MERRFGISNRTLMTPPLDLGEIPEERGVVAEAVAPGTAGGAAPDVGGVFQARQQRRVDERLVDAEAVAPVRRVPRVGARLGAQVAERVGPSAVGERVDPALLARAEHGNLFVEPAAARVRVADQQRGPAAPAPRAAEHRVEERVLAPAHAVGHVHGADDERPRRSEEHTSELQSLAYLVCRLLLEKKKPSNTDDTRRPERHTV